MSKSNEQEFTTDWMKAINWANANKIPSSAVKAVYALDSQRIANSEYPMSQAERTRAMLAASNLETNTVLPTDLPSAWYTPMGFFSNARNDLSSIFTGISGFFNGETEKNIWDEAVNTFEHPQDILNPKDNTLMQWVPGWSDIGMLMKGGFSGLADHPILSVLDVLPLGDTGLRAVARSGVLDDAAARVGLTRDQLTLAPAKGGSGSLTRFVGRNLMSIPYGKAKFLAKDADGNVLAQSMTVGQRLRTLARSAPDTADLGSHIFSINAKETQYSTLATAPLNKALAKLTDDERIQLASVIERSGKTYEQALNDPSLNLTPDQLDAWDKYRTWKDWYQERILSDPNSKLTLVTMPDGTPEIYTKSVFGPIERAGTRYSAALEILNRASSEVDGLAAHINLTDSQAAPMVMEIANLAPAVYQVVKGVDPFREQYEDDAIAQLMRIDPSQVTADQQRMLDEILSPGGLIDQMKLAYDKGDFKAYKTILRRIQRKFDTKALNPLHSPEISRFAGLVNELYEYSKYRAKLEDMWLRAYRGTSKASRGRSVQALMEEAAKAKNDFEKAVIAHPPDRYRPAFLDILSRKTAEAYTGAEKLQSTKEALMSKGMDESEMNKLLQDPRRLAEMIDLYTLGAGEDPFMGALPTGDMIQIRNSTLNELASVRAEGFSPEWVPNISSKDVVEDPTYNVHIPLTRIPTIDAVRSRLYDYTDTVNDIGLAVNHATKQILARDGAIDLIDNYIIPQFGYKIQDLLPILTREDHLPDYAKDAVSRLGAANHLLESKYGLVRFDPNAMFNIVSAKVGRDALYIPKDIADALDITVNRDQLGFGPGLMGTIGRGTEVFRTSVLAFSPRFTAHIGFGGTLLLALRSTLHSVKFIGDAWDFARKVQRGEITPENPMFEIIQRPTQYGEAGDVISHADRAFHYAGGKQLGNMWVEKIIGDQGWDKSKLSSWLTAAASANYKLTGFMSTMQRAIAYLDGADKLARQEARRGFILDENGQRVALTAERAHFEGMKAVDRTMGNLRAMSPFERHTLTTLMPFYGWTKHILRYVASYPMDHPYRAMVISNLANMNSEDVPSGLPLRIQLLFFLGSPNQDGTVTALDIRALNPLRDVANYATWSGLLSALNPVVTGPLSTIDPEIIYGGNVLYPTLSYSSLYGVREAAPAGNIGNFISSYIPQFQALEAALQLGAQYRQLRKQDPTAFVNTITTALGIPFTPETINLKQMAASAEISKYQVASQAAQAAWESGDFSQIAGYPSVPDPNQPDYNITPEELAQQYDEILRSTGQPPAEVTPELPAPAGLG